jgi:cobalt/nickel transport system permease protein
MENRIPAYLLLSVPVEHDMTSVKKVKISFLDKTILKSAGVIKSIYLQAENAARDNIIHKINPHVKFFSLIYLAVVISIVNPLRAQLLISFFILSFYILARLRILHVYRRIFFLAFIFGFLVVLPASLNIITPGKIIFKLISFNKPSHFWIYNIPQNIGFTENGFQVVALVFLRVFNSVSLALLIVFTTSFPAFIKSFKIIGVPDTFQMVISLAYKYIFILCRTIEETYFALKSRLSANIKVSGIRNLVSGRIFFIFKRSMIIYENTYYAMVSRGYHGKVKLHSQNHFTLMDFITLIIIIAIGITAILF